MILVVVDLTRRDSLRGADRWIGEVMEATAGETKAPTFILVGAKSDLVAAREISSDELQQSVLCNDDGERQGGQKNTGELLRSERWLGGVGVAAVKVGRHLHASEHACHG